jgi:O-phosphoseryl-tRNA(Cys) synthetase
MASKKQKAQKAAMQARANPYLRRIADDEDLRQNLYDAYESVRKAYSRLSNGKSPTKQIFDDKKFQKEVKNAASNVRDASVALREAPKKKGGLSLKRVLLIGAVGTGVALAVSEGLRKKVLDTLFGAEEEFEYTSNTSSASSPQTTASTN